MSVCPTCHTDYGSQVNYCEICKISLVDVPLPDDPAGEDIGNTELAELATFSNVSEAEMIKEILERNEIRTIQRGEVDPIGVASGAEPITLLVEERFLARARELYAVYFGGTEEASQSDPDQAAE